LLVPLPHPARHFAVALAGFGVFSFIDEKISPETDKFRLLSIVAPAWLLHSRPTIRHSFSFKNVLAA